MISSSATGLTYTSGTGVFSFTDDLYNIPLTASTTEWTNGYADRVTLDNPNTWTASQTFSDALTGNLTYVTAGSSAIEAIRGATGYAAGDFRSSSNHAGAYLSSSAGYGVEAYNNTGTAAGYFTGGANNVTLANGTYAINATGQSTFATANGAQVGNFIYTPSGNNVMLATESGTALFAQKGSGGTSAGLFSDSANSVLLADGMYVINASGSMKLSGDIHDSIDEVSLEPSNRRLKDQYGLPTIDWSGAQNSSAGLSFDSLQGGYFSKGLNVTDGTRTVALADGTIAVNATGGYSNFSYNGTTAQFGNSGVAGYFTNGGRYLVLADGTYAIDATGNSRFTGNVELSNATADTLASFDGSKNLVSLDTGTYPSLTELAYVKGVTSAIQTQLDGTALLAGRSTPQQFNFGTASGASTGYLTSTSHATKGKYFLNSAGTITVDEANERFGVGTSSPSAKLHLIGTSNLFRAGYDTSNYFTADVSSTGTTTFDAVGSGASFNFSDAVVIPNGPNDATPYLSIAGLPGYGIRNRSGLFTFVSPGGGGGPSMAYDSSGVYLRGSNQSAVVLNTATQELTGSWGTLSAFGVGISPTSLTGDSQLDLRPLAARIGLKIQLASSQTGNAMTVLDNTGTNLFNISAAGRLGVGEATPQSPVHLRASTNPSVTITSGAYASGKDAMFFGVVTSANSFVNGTVAGDSAVVAKSGGVCFSAPLQQQGLHKGILSV
jgi:hypothetical protein